MRYLIPVLVVALCLLIHPTTWSVEDGHDGQPRQGVATGKDAEKDEDDHDKKRDHGDKKQEHLVLDRLPADVRKTLLKHANGQRVKEISSRVEKGVTVYVSEIKNKNGETKIVVAANGKLVRIVTEEEDD